ncbi:MAG: hypothetical protein ACMG57_03100 [Candidatus Dojkabacteria bacterium]
MQIKPEEQNYEEVDLDQKYLKQIADALEEGDERTNMNDQFEFAKSQIAQYEEEAHILHIGLAFFSFLSVYISAAEVEYANGNWSYNRIEGFTIGLTLALILFAVLSIYSRKIHGPSIWEDEVQQIEKWQEALSNIYRMEDNDEPVELGELLRNVNKLEP